MSIKKNTFTLLCIFHKPLDATRISEWVGNELEKGGCSAKAIYCGKPEDRDKAEQVLRRFAKAVSPVLGVCHTQFIADPFGAAAVANRARCDLVVLAQTRVARPVLRTIGGQTRSEKLEIFVTKCRRSFLLVKQSTAVRRVLFCTDGSRDATTALQLFLRMPATRKPTLTIANIVSDLLLHFNEYLGSLGKNVAQTLEKIPSERTKNLIKAKELCMANGYPVRIKLLEGRFCEFLQKEVEQDYDLLLMGARGRLSRNQKSGLGKHASKILFFAPSSVLIAHEEL